MLRARVDLELRELLTREAVARKHALDGLADDLRRPPGELLSERALPQTTWVPGVAVVDLVVELLARDRDLLRIDDDDEIAGVDVRGVLRLALATQRVGDLRREPPKGLPLGVDDVPAALDFV